MILLTGRGREGGGNVRETLRAALNLISEYSNKRLALLEETSFQTDDDELESRTTMPTNVIRDFLDVGVVECSVDLIQDKERAGLIRVDGKEESQGGDCLLAAREVLHVAESLHRRHGVVFDSIKVGFVTALHVQVAVSIFIKTIKAQAEWKDYIRSPAQGESNAHSEIFVNPSNLLRDMVKGFLK